MIPMRTTIPSCAFVVVALLSAGPAGAQPAPGPAPDLAGKSLEDLMSVDVGTVFGAAKREQRVTEAPSSVTILTADDIRRFGWHTLAEALTSVRGFYVTNDRNWQYVGVRGFGRPSDYNNRVLMLVNGHRYNDNIYDQALVGLEFPIDLALVDRIEVIRGPGSALYGTSAFFAVINVVLKPGGAVGGSESSVEAGSFDTWRFRTSYGGRTRTGFDTLLSVSHTRSDGQALLFFPEYDDPATGGGFNAGADGESATSVFGSIQRGRLSVHGTYASRNKVVPTGSYETTFDDRNSTVDSRGWLDASLSGAFRGAALTGRAFVDYSGYRGTYVYPGAEPGEAETHSRDAADGVWVGMEGTATRRIGARHQVTGGLEYRRNLRQDQSSYDVDPLFANLDSRYQSNQAAIFAQDEILLHRRLTATVGARYDWWSLTGGTATPRVGLVYRTDADTAVKALYGEAYRAPSVYETWYYPDPFGRALRPERVRTSEVVWEQHLGRTTRLTATAYLTAARDLISQGADYYFENREQAESRGVELEAERRWTNGMMLRGSFVAQETRDPVADVELSNSPRRLGLVHLAAPAWSRRISMAAEGQYVGRRWSTQGTPIPGVWLTHVTVAYTPPRQPLAISARVANLFDAQHAHPVGFEHRQDVVPQDGRSVSVKATLRF
jgi:iron complex outermembrane receptor protein